MIINLRGTSGAGKSTLVRAIMARFIDGGEVQQHYAQGRKQPLWYTLRNPSTPRPLLVLGHYETACGGCDTIKTVDQVYELVRRGSSERHNVLYEGIMVQDDVRRIAELVSQGTDTVRVIFLDVDIEECLRGVRSRREARGDDRPLDETNTRSRAVSLARTEQRLRAAGVPVERLDREAALSRVRTLLGAP